jgi:hypothetical protein
MLFQLDDLKIPAPAFRVLFSIIRRAYHSKVTIISKSTLCEKTDLSDYIVTKALDVLTSRKLVQIVEVENYQLKITLLPDVIEWIEKDFKRQKRVSGKTKAFGEIKKHGSSNKKVTVSKKESTKSSSTTTTKSLPPGLPNSSTVQEKPTRLKKERQTNQSTSTQSNNLTYSTQPTSPKHQKPVLRLEKSQKGLANQPSKFNYIGERPAYLTVRNELYSYFREWLKNNNSMSCEFIDGLTAEELQKRWKQFKEYSVTWLKLQKVISTPCMDLNKIRFMRGLAANIEKAA